MVLKANELRAHYDTLKDQELERLARTDLVPEARTALQAEMAARGLAAGAQVPFVAPARNPYSAPGTAVSDPHAWATLKVSGLIRLFQVMVCASTVIGLFNAFWPYLPLPLAETVSGMRKAAGADALAPGFSELLIWAMQPLWILSAFGLCFFKWWARPIFAGTYVLGTVANLLGGLIVWLPWEAVLITLTTLLDGAVLALAFLPPLSTHFERDRLAG